MHAGSWSGGWGMNKTDISYGFHVLQLQHHISPFCFLRRYSSMVSPSLRAPNFIAPSFVCAILGFSLSNIQYMISDRELQGENIYATY